MAHWCMRDVDYSALDFFQKAALMKDRARADDDSFVRQPSDLKLKDTGDDSNLHGAALRSAILGSRQSIPKIVARWPSNILRLTDVVLPEECDSIFHGSDSSGDELWLAILQGLLQIRPDDNVGPNKAGSCCELECIDLTGFVPTRGLLYTFVLMVPLLSVTQRYFVTVDQICNHAAQVLNDGLKNDASLNRCLRKFVGETLNHSLFERGHFIHVPKNRLNIIVDFLRISADTPSFLCCLVADVISHVTNVHVKFNSVIYTYVNCESATNCERNKSVTVAPLIPLQTVASLPSLRDVEGIAVQSVPADRTVDVLAVLSSRLTVSESGHQHVVVGRMRRFVSKLSVADCNVDLSISQHHLLFKSFVSVSHIRRLDISGTKLDGRLGDILRHAGGHIEYLCLSRCRCRSSDIDALFELPTMSAICDLDLSHISSTDCSDCSKNECSPLATTAVRTKQPFDSEIFPDNSSQRQEHSLGLTTVELSSANFEDPDDVRTHRLSEHTADRNLVNHLMARLASLSAARLSNLAILDITNECYHSGMSSSETTMTYRVATNFPRLRHLSVERFPLSYDCIIELVRNVSTKSDDSPSSFPSSIQSLAVTLTRPSNAASSSVADKVEFWNQLEKAKHGRRLRLSVDNY